MPEAQLIPMTLLKNHTPYFEGEIAGFTEEEALELEEKEIAKRYAVKTKKPATPGAKQ